MRGSLVRGVTIIGERSVLFPWGIISRRIRVIAAIRYFLRPMLLVMAIRELNVE